MDLLRDVQLERKRRHGDGVDPGEREEIRPDQHLRLPIRWHVEADVDEGILEATPAEIGLNVVSHRSAFEKLIKLGGPFDAEVEVVAHVDVRGSQEVGCRGLLASCGCQIHVLRGPGARSEAIVEGKPAFEHPTARRGDEEPRQQPVERDLFSEPDEGVALAAAERKEACLEGLPESRGRGVPHGVISDSAASMRFLILRPRDRAAARIRAGVVRPRSIAWRVASITCSGAAPLSATSTMVRAGVVMRRPSRVKTSADSIGRVVVWVETPGSWASLRRARGTVRWIEPGMMSESSSTSSAESCEIAASGARRSHAAMSSSRGEDG